MSDDLELVSAVEVQAYQAKEVQHLLGHEGLKAAIKATRERIIKQWETADTVEAREWCRMKLEAFKELQTELRGFGDRRPSGS